MWVVKLLKKLETVPGFCFIVQYLKAPLQVLTLQTAVAETREELMQSKAMTRELLRFILSRQATANSGWAVPPGGAHFLPPEDIASFEKVLDDLYATAPLQVPTLQIAIAEMRKELMQSKAMTRELLRFILSRQATANNDWAVPSGNAHSLQPENPVSFEKALDDLHAMAPNAFPEWKKLLAESLKVYDGFPIDSCSVEGQRLSALFQAYLAPYLKGAVLDIGCGPQPVPLYLKGYPTEYIAGLDPLPPTAESHPFAFVRGIAEFLPWPDETFDLVVAATSLDHVLLPERVFAEIHRVLKKDGRFVAWVCFFPDSPSYEPYAPEVKRIDPCHLFHFTAESFAEWSGNHFEVDDHIDLNLDIGLSNFYCLKPIVSGKAL